MKKIILSENRDERLLQIRDKFYRDIPKHEPETRYIPIQGLELRQAVDDTPAHVIGYGAVFNKFSEGLWFREIVDPGAFADSLKSDSVVGLFNHDRNIVLGRNTANTMDLSEDKIGLLYDISMPDTQWGRDVPVSITRGDIIGSSFSFTTIDDDWVYSEDGETVERRLIKVKLFDTGPVTFAAYPDTTTSVRSINDWLNGQQMSAGEKPWRRNIARRRLDLAAL